MPTPKNIATGRTCDPIVRALCETYSGASPGTKIEHAHLVGMIGAHEKSNRYRTVVQKWKARMLRDHGVVIRSLRGEGYQICTGDDAVRETVREARAAASRLRAGHAKAIAADEDTLSPPYRRARGLMLAYAARAIEFHRRSVDRETRDALAGKTLPTPSSYPIAGRQQNHHEDTIQHEHESTRNHA